ncbi:hypothetical protein AN640_02970 [Candidatus Epulonipiscium fishelsonii]|uniref:Uncharacterized protein n=1 Tax=Candidatus Epulonipiscium fishelsonii TaxID=77094 RepID=A0ACC8X7Y1_9FIRM|nr:hypothetical protein AN640_02970 [Epulopiscium sp. SCG-D08WGA-EpuloA1]OON90641.1 MAG: hypothetical protein ATN32_03520 [Epulopiscium sp. AS2M-Bin002]
MKLIKRRGFMNRWLTIFLTIFLMTTVSGCTQNIEEHAKAKVVPEEIVLIDRAGNKINIKNEYNKIISFAPSLSEILLDLGYEDKIIAITTVDSTFNNENIQVFDMMNPDIESIMALEPDLILTTELTSSGQSNPFAELEKSGVTIATIPTATTINGIYEDLDFIGKLLNEETKTTAIINNMKNVVDYYKQKSMGIEDKKTVYFEISPAPYMFSTGRDTYLNEMIEIVGAENIFTDQVGWFSPTSEMILTDNPDVILTNVDYVENPVEEIKSRNGWDVINAVKNNEVFYIDNNATSIPNHNIVKGIKDMAKIIYPEYYKE